MRARTVAEKTDGSPQERAGQEPEMFTVHFINFGYSRQYPTLAEAVAAARQAGFEASITMAGALYATFCPISGLSHKRPVVGCNS